MTLEELEQWNDEFDNNFVGKKYEEQPEITVKNGRITVQRSRYSDFTADVILVTPLNQLLEISESRSKYIHYKKIQDLFERRKEHNRNCKTLFCDLEDPIRVLFDKAEKAKGRYSKGLNTQEEKDLILYCKLKNLYSGRPLH